MELLEKIKRAIKNTDKLKRKEIVFSVQDAQKLVDYIEMLNNKYSALEDQLHNKPEQMKTGPVNITFKGDPF